jgi:hypothetical protein
MPEWSQRARRAALALSGVLDLDDERPGIRLLSDVRELFASLGADRITMKELVDSLHSGAFEEHPWQEWNNGRGLKASGVGRLLRPFGIRARQLWIAGEKLRGYELQQFADAFARYLPLPAEGTLDRYTARIERETEHEPSALSVQAPVAGEKAAAGNGSLNGSPTPYSDKAAAIQAALGWAPREEEQP